MRYILAVEKPTIFLRMVTVVLQDRFSITVRGFFAVGHFAIKKNVSFGQVKNLRWVKLGQVWFFYFFYAELSHCEKSQSPESQQCFIPSSIIVLQCSSIRDDNGTVAGDVSRIWNTSTLFRLFLAPFSDCFAKTINKYYKYR